jgi:DNA-binding response OmpR family regulator
LTALFLPVVYVGVIISILKPCGARQGDVALEEEQKSILVVDDDEAIRQMVGTLLADEGYQVEMAHNGEEAIRMIRQRPFNLVILDILMPVMDGWEVASRMLCEEETRDLPIIFLTALSSYTDQLKGWRMGCFDYITKPFDIGLFLMRVKAALEKASRQSAATALEVEGMVEQKMEQLLQLMSETLQRDFGLRRVGVVDVVDDYAVKEGE